MDDSPCYLSPSDYLNPYFPGFIYPGYMILVIAVMAYAGER